MNIPRKITIEAVLNGFVCKVGCQTVVFNSIHDLVVELGDYLRQPEETEKKFRTQAINRAILFGPLAPEPQAVVMTGCDGACEEVPPPPVNRHREQRIRDGGLIRDDTAKPRPEDCETQQEIPSHPDNPVGMRR